MSDMTVVSHFDPVPQAFAVIGPDPYADPS